MNALPAAIALLCSGLTGCALSRPPPHFPAWDPNAEYQREARERSAAEKAAEDARKAELQARRDAALEQAKLNTVNLNACATKYAQDHRKSALTGNELAEAAISACGSFVIAVREAMQTYAIGLGDFAERERYSKESAALVEHNAKGLVLRVIAETAK